MGGISFIPTAAQVGAVPITRDLIPGANVTLNGGATPVALSADVTIAASGGGGGGTIDVEDSGSLIVSASTLNFTGAGVTATDLGGGVAGIDIPGGGGASASYCKAYNGGTQTINSGAATVVALNSELFDTDSYHDNTTNNSRLVAPATGVYQVSYNVVWAGGGANDRIAFLRLNAAGGGTDAANVLGATNVAPGGSGYNPTNSLTTLIALNAGDYVELFVYQSSGGTKDIGAATGGTAQGAYTSVEIVRIA